ncbi:MAG: glyoxylase-like metal-dependent hydrolase (beta-lactamase superfamily II) [Natronomonas sp.]|jgi:glyoxylase-like metal-dependent hydrolase (beta-lactamase superfamily II)|uniref:MBL fold metallo-hydrolase n=1 Tax=Natronomonas sp. TaxID=2184060 RepID=UPI0039898A17
MATELIDGVWQFELRGVNAYLVDDDVPTLVDAGTPWDEETLRAGLDEAGVAVSDIGRVLLTHYDLDHVGTLAALAPELDAPIYAGQFDADILANRRSPPVTNHKGAFQRLAGLAVTHPSLAIEPIDDGEAIGTFTAYHTPGHTPGHVAYVSAELGVGLLGDLVSESEGALEASGWALSYDTGDVRESIISLSERSSPFGVACIGHGTPITTDGSDVLETLARQI